MSVSSLSVERLTNRITITTVASVAFLPTPSTALISVTIGVPIDGIIRIRTFSFSLSARLARVIATRKTELTCSVCYDACFTIVILVQRREVVGVYFDMAITAFHSTRTLVEDKIQ